MAIKLGSSAVTLKLGSQSVTGYLGDTIVTATVPGVPTNAEYDGGANEFVWDPPLSDGGSSVVYYKVYINGVYDQQERTGTNMTPPESGDYEVSAVNAVGEGPKTDPVAITVP